MILYLEANLNFKKINKLDKIYDHYKEKAKVKFIHTVLKNKNYENLKSYDISTCTYNIKSNVWNISYTLTPIDLPEYIFYFLSTPWFKNFPINENVYFYRYVNIIQTYFSQQKFLNLIHNLKKKILFLQITYWNMKSTN